MQVKFLGIEQIDYGIKKISFSIIGRKGVEAEVKTFYYTPSSKKNSRDKEELDTYFITDTPIGDLIGLFLKCINVETPYQAFTACLEPGD